MSLKELTKQNHSNAERSWFAGRMFSGQITNPEYAVYLKQQYESYKALESRFDSLGSESNVQFPDERIKRADNIYKDLKLDRSSKKTILLSPAAASFDQFSNFEKRGIYFKNLILKKFKRRLNV